MNCRMDLHLHTLYSPDGRMTLSQAVAAAKKRGISALAVSDHNRCAPKEVFDEPLRDGVLLIPAVEYSTEAGHLLGLFLHRPCRCPNEEAGRVRFSDAAAAIHDAGGLCVLAHPYELTRHSVEEISAQIVQNEPLLDGIEIFNCRATKKRANANALAKAAAERCAKPILQTAGSDAHTPAEVGRAYVEVTVPELTPEALREALCRPVGYACGKCPHMALARSQWTQLRKKKCGVKACVRWLLFAAVCCLRSVKGVFQ